MDFGQFLEYYVDQVGINGVIDGLQALCYEKAEHVRLNWQDEGLARQWEKAGKLLDKVNLPDLP